MMKSMPGHNRLHRVENRRFQAYKTGNYFGVCRVSKSSNSLSSCLILIIFAAMVSVSNISYYIGGRALYENASMFIKPKDKIGLIGLNGRGKSTLLRIINGEMKLDSGSISKSGDCTIGFLNQDLLSFQSDDSILTVA